MASEYRIRNTTVEDQDILWEIYHEAQDFMIATGNPNQWGRKSPKPEMLLRDLQDHTGYVILKKKDDAPEETWEIIGTFALILGEDPTYKKIEGKWLNDRPYGTIHRIAGRTKEHGVFQAAIEFAASKTDNIRIDTHEDNKPMRHLIEKAGFTYCGIIYIADGTPRLAFQKVVRES